MVVAVVVGFFIGATMDDTSFPRTDGTVTFRERGVCP